VTSENRQPHEDMLLTAADAARFRQVLAACSMLVSWAEASLGPRFAAAAQDAAEAAGLSRAPGALAGEVNLAIDVIDFSSPGRRAR
jgi:hypothetical protein